MITTPYASPEEVRAYRVNKGLSQDAAGHLVQTDGRNWRRYESGQTPIPVVVLLAFLLLTDQHPTHQVKIRR